ncbi:hypothetical protein NM208_g2547 [Fusarium decemcellulare]|uniref:Uncharacterized protein n=2 Tax=Fusarium decemcellulare TaxID=57161 RepID=A0ACC1SSK4_9HYPO|nr:hypothetical protein NM208_g5703 [Fusarium decemcellulare]KAJ3545341.1 hypothetical protein NM208_g2547 [Fusarium decemcellulare]
MAFSTGSSLEIFNPSFNSQSIEGFSNFSRLPRELRWAIWQLGLQHERLLHVEVRSSKSHCTATERPLDKQRDHQAYEIILSERQPISKLSHVNFEAREITHRFYRVQLPCLYRWEGKEDTEGIFYFHPELDTLEIRGEPFASFAQDLWAHDTRSIDLINLAVSIQFIPEEPLPPITNSLLPQVFSRFRRVIFLYLGLVASCKVQYDHEVGYRFLVAYGGRRMRHGRRQGVDFSVDLGWSLHVTTPEIHDRDDAIGWVRQQDEKWRDTLQEMHEEILEMENEGSYVEPYPNIERPLEAALLLVGGSLQRTEVASAAIAQIDGTVQELE